MSIQLILIAGLSASGKTTLANDLARELDAPILRLDDYYRDIEPGYSPEEVAEFNWDRLEMFHLQEFGRDALSLAYGQTIERPTYDFSLSRRGPETVVVAPSDFVIIEGQFVLAIPEICQASNLGVFVDLPVDEALARRLDRDVKARGRCSESVFRQWQGHVLPAYTKWVLPSEANADLVLNGNADRGINTKHVLNEIRSRRASLI